MSQPIGTLPSNKIANWFIAPLQFGISIVHLWLKWRKAKYSNLNTASSEGEQRAILRDLPQRRVQWLNRVGRIHRTPDLRRVGEHRHHPRPVQFNAANSYDPDGAITTYRWDFGDSVTGHGITPTRTYGEDGSQTATLTVIDTYGATSTATATVSISGAPTPPKDTIDAYSIGGEDVRWNQSNRPSVDDPDNGRGTPPSRSEGNGNFQIAAPVISCAPFWASVPAAKPGRPDL